MGIGETWLSTKCKKCGAQQVMMHWHLGNGPSPIVCSNPKCNVSNLIPLPRKANGDLKWMEESKTMSDPVVSGPTIYLERSTGKYYRLRGCGNELCYCSGACQERIYMDAREVAKERRHATARREGRLDFLHRAAWMNKERGEQCCPECEGKVCGNYTCPLLLKPMAVAK